MPGPTFKLSCQFETRAELDDDGSLSIFQEDPQHVGDPTPVVIQSEYVETFLEGLRDLAGFPPDGPWTGQLPEIRAEALRAMLAAGATAEMIVAAVEASQAAGRSVINPA